MIWTAASHVLARRIPLTVLPRYLFVAAFACCVATLWGGAALASIDFNTVGGSYTQDFNSLPNTSSNTGGILQGTGTGQFTNGWQDDTTTVAGDHFSIPG